MKLDRTAPLSRLAQRPRSDGATPPPIGGGLASPAGEAAPFRVITFNTAAGNGRIETPQEAFVALPFFQDVVRGRPDAPILAGQETGPAQAAELKRLSRNGNFTVLHADVRRAQGNILLVPKRFEVVSHRHVSLREDRARGILQSLKNWLTKGERPVPYQLIEPRMYTEAVLRDRQSGRTFTVFNTHLSTHDPIKLEQAEQLFAAVAQARARGPVLVAGDLNVKAANSNPTSPTDARIRRMFADLQDLGPTEPPGRRANIDYVLGDGFESVGSRYYLGTSLSLPGFPRAEVISDHYAEENRVVFRRAKL